jgi:FkbH-like protein
MKVKVFGSGGAESTVQDALTNQSPAAYVPIVRNWLLAGPKFSEFEVLARFLARPEISEKLAKELPTERWLVVGGYTTRPVATSIAAALLAHGSFAILYEAAYGAFDIEVLSGTSPIFAFNPDHVLLCVGHHHIPALSQTAREAGAAEVDREAFSYLRSRWDKLQKATGATIHQHALCPPDYSESARFSQKYEWSRKRRIARLNDQIWDCDGHDVFVVPTDEIQNRLGAEQWWSPRWYQMGKLPFNPLHQSAYATTLYAHIAAIRGKPRKCLVVDLDNTLWGGVVGDDGVEGLVFGNGSAAGEEFLEVASFVRELSHSGVIIGVVSKNDERIAKAAFSQLVDMPLRAEDFAGFRANWESKSKNLAELVGDLNIGMDGVVYLDDSAVECADIAKAFPEAIVLQVCDGAEGVAQTLSRLQLFDRLSFTDEDANRNATYAATRRARIGSTPDGNVQDLLRSLGMSAVFEPVRMHQVPRVSQLFGKTNQFNLTQIKYTEAEIQNMPERVCFTATLADQYAKYGLVSAMVLRLADDHQAEMENWVMSCRVFNRTLEQFMLMQLRGALRQKSITSLRARLFPTDRNGYVQSTFAKLGFRTTLSGDNTQVFEVDLGVNSPNWQTFVREQADD